MNLKSFLLICVSLVIPALFLSAEEPSVGGKLQADVIYQTDGIAIQGYDPVSYFEDDRAEKGEKELEHLWMGATWRFSSEKNRNLFVQNPEKYAPQYGGYCAYGMSFGYAAPTQAVAWSIFDGKLYLNYNREVRKKWKTDVSGYLSKADVNWPKIPKKPQE